MKILTRLLVLVCLSAGSALAQHGPAAKQVSVNTGSFGTLSPAAPNLQSVLNWIDGNLIFTGDGYLKTNELDATYVRQDVAGLWYSTITNAAMSYASLSGGNLFSEYSTQQVYSAEVRGGLRVTSAGRIYAAPTSLTCTNAGTLTLNGSAAVVSPYGQAAGSVATVVLPTPAVAGQLYALTVSADATNSLAVLKTGNYVGTAFTNLPGTGRLLFAPTASTWTTLGQ